MILPTAVMDVGRSLWSGRFKHLTWSLLKLFRDFLGQWLDFRKLVCSGPRFNLVGELSQRNTADLVKPNFK